MRYDITCPKCGPFQMTRKPLKNERCPRCGSKDIISLHHRDDIDLRFKQEKERAANGGVSVYHFEGESDT